METWKFYFQGHSPNFVVSGWAFSTAVVLNSEQLVNKVNKIPRSHILRFDTKQAKKGRTKYNPPCEVDVGKIILLFHLMIYLTGTPSPGEQIFPHMSVELM